MFRMRHISAAALAAAAIALAPAAAQAESVRAETVALDQWSYDALYAEGFSADHFMNADVVDNDGEHVGEVEDLVMHPDGRVTGLIIETDGFLDIGDKHILYGFDDAEIEGIDRVRVNVDEKAIENYSLFGNVDDAAIAGKKWRMSRLLGEYAYLEDDKAYGFVEDAVLNRDGEIKAVVIASDVGYGAGGPYAYPFYQGYEPMTGRYEMGYRDGEIGNMPEFDTLQMYDWPRVDESG